MACHPRSSMSCYPRTRLQTSRRWEIRGQRTEDQRTRETEAPEDPTDSEQPVESIHFDGDNNGGEGSERPDGTQPTKPPEWQGTPDRQDSSCHSSHSRPRPSPSASAIMPRSPLLPLLDHLPPSHPRWHAVTRRQDKIPQQPGWLCSEHSLPIHPSIHNAWEGNPHPSNALPSACHASCFPTRLSPFRLPSSPPFESR